MQCTKCHKKVYANELCVCGEKAPKKHNVAVAINSIVCFLIVLISTLCLILTLSLRTVVNDNLLVDAIEDVKLAELRVDDKKLNEYIYDEFIEDERITIDNVNNLLEEPFIKDFLIEKVEAYNDYLLDKADAPYITADDVIGLIEENEELLYEEAGLRFLDADKEELRQELEGLDEFKVFTDDFLNSYFGSALVQTYFSGANAVFLIVLLVVVLIQWFAVYVANSRRAGKMALKYGIAVLIPSVIFIAGVLTLVIMPSLEIADELLASAKFTFLINSLIMLFVGIVFTVIGIMSGRSYKKARAVAKRVQDEAVMQFEEEQVNGGEKPQVQDLTEITVNPTETLDLSEVAPVEATPVEETPKLESAPENKCPQCTFVNREGAAFCSRCGTKLSKTEA